MMLHFVLYSPLSNLKEVIELFKVINFRVFWNLSNMKVGLKKKTFSQFQLFKEYLDWNTKSIFSERMYEFFLKIFLLLVCFESPGLKAQDFRSTSHLEFIVQHYCSYCSHCLAGCCYIETTLNLWSYPLCYYSNPQMRSHS